MKIAIVTMHRVFNCGSVWQTYSLCETLKRMGHKVEVIDYVQPRFRFRNFIASRSKQPVYKLLIDILIYANYRRIFNIFMKKYLALSKSKYFSYSNLVDKLPVADIYMTGSDQVWNSYYNEHIDPVYFLDFAPPGIKRVSYAASFGKESLDSDEIERTGELIRKYDSISVREDSALNILRGLGRSDGVHVLDPTFLLNKQEWLGMAGENEEKEKYLLIYSLTARDKVIEFARIIAKERNLKTVIITSQLKKVKECDRSLKFVSPEEFLSLFIHADFVVTNSFHGTAFSINLNKQFISVPHPEFNTRISSVLQIANLSGRLVNDAHKVKEIAMKKIDYENVNARLSLERYKAQQFLVNALK